MRVRNFNNQENSHVQCENNFALNFKDNKEEIKIIRIASNKKEQAVLKMNKMEVLEMKTIIIKRETSVCELYRIVNINREEISKFENRSEKFT